MDLRKLIKFNERKILSSKWLYIVGSAIFLIWISLLSDNNCNARKKLKNKREMLIKQKNAYIEKIKRDSIKINQLKTNNANLEKFARENYLMSENDEDIIVISDK